MHEFAPGFVFLQEHPVRFAGGRLLTRMTLIRLDDGGLILHSPVPIDAPLRAEIMALGEVRAIVAPSTLHHLFVADAQRAFPHVPTYAVEGLAKKRSDLQLVRLPADLWQGEIEMITLGNSLMREVVMLHRASRTVIGVDFVEHIGDATRGTDRVMRTWLKMLGMWNKPRPAPELRWFTWDREAARRAIEAILAWDFNRMVIAHGEPFERGAKDALREAWSFVLR